MSLNLAYALIGALSVVILVLAVICLLVIRRRPASVADEGWRAEKAGLEVKLAVEAERAARVALLETDLSRIQAEREKAEQDLASEKARADRIPALEAELGRVREARDQAVRQLATVTEARDRLGADKTTAAEQAATQAGALEASRSEAADLRTRLARLTEALEQERKQAEEKLALLTEAKDLMAKQFQVLANDVMSKHGENFSKQNKEQIDTLLLPLRDKLKEFQEGLQRAHEDTGKERATLAEQIRALSEQSAKMGVETLNLTRALKGGAQMQGAWGEMILETLLEKSGLREGEEYVRQATHTTDEGGRVRTDVIVNLPGGQHVILDSKVSLVAFEAYVNAEDDETRALNLGAHVASMRAHIKSLAQKEYHAATGGGLDYVIMFVPIEGALGAALQRDPSLTSYAVQNNVAIATPTTLMIALRTIENVWKVERRNQNAEAIAERAGHLYSKFVGFVDDMQGLGRRLGQAQSSYTAAMGKLQTGSGNLVGQAEKLKELGAKTTKTLPKGLVLDEGLSAEGTAAELHLPDLRPSLDNSGDAV